MAHGLELNYERLDSDIVPDEDRLEAIAHGIQRVMRIAYTRAFEKQQREYRLESGTVRRELFDETNPSRVQNQISRMEKHMHSSASVYWLGWDYDELIGLAKTSPVIPHKKNMYPSNCYLNDVAVIYEGFGHGSGLLSKALGDYIPDRHATLDAYRGNDRANDWFERLGFKPRDSRQPEASFEIGNVAVPQFKMEAASVGSVIENLSVKSD